MTSSGTINSLDPVTVGIGAMKLKYQNIDQVRGLRVGDVVEYETNEKGWIASIRRIDGDTRESAPAMTPGNPQDEHTAAGVKQGGTVSSISTPSTNSHSQSREDQQQKDRTAKVESQSSQRSEPGLPPHDTPVQTIIHKHEGQESRLDSISFADSVRYPGGKMYFNTLDMEQYKEIRDNFFKAYIESLEQMRQIREQYPDLTNGSKGVKS